MDVDLLDAVTGCPESLQSFKAVDVFKLLKAAFTTHAMHSVRVQREGRERGKRRRVRGITSD